MMPLQKAPNIIKIGACLFYELLVMIAIAFIGAAIFVLVFGDATQGTKRIFLQGFIWILIGTYFVMSWVKRGQTLPMRSWKLLLICQTQQHAEPVRLINVRTAIVRYMVATLGLLLFGVGFFWRWFDKDQLFLHDRLMNSKVVVLQD